MTSAGSIEALRAEVLRKVGRNVVNFQKVEACLKFLVVVSKSQGRLATFTNQFRKKSGQVEKKTLGNLAGAFSRQILDEVAESQAPLDIDEIWLSVSLTVAGDPLANEERKLALTALVNERNNLIHRDLIRFDHNSEQSCRDLINVLDAQNPRILEQLDYMKALIDATKQHFADLQTWVDSDEFLRQLRQGSSDT